MVSGAKEYGGLLLHRTADGFAHFSPEGRQSPINLPSRVSLRPLGLPGFRVLGVGFTNVCGCPCKTSAKLLYRPAQLDESCHGQPLMGYGTLNLGL